MRAIKSLKESTNLAHLEEYTAARALQEESEKQSYEFLKLFVSGSIKMKEEKKRNHSKIATWEDYQEKVSDSKVEAKDLLGKRSMNREINYARWRLIRRNVEKMQTQSTNYRSKYDAEEREIQKQPVFSISLLNPKIEEEGRKSEEKIRVKAKIPSNFMNYLAVPQVQEGKDSKFKERNARVHNLKQSDKGAIVNNTKIQYIDLNYSLPDCKPSQDLDARILSAAAVARFSKKSSAISEFRQKKTLINVDNMKREKRRNASLKSSNQLKQSSQFQKLRQLLNLQKI